MASADEDENESVALAKKLRSQQPPFLWLLMIALLLSAGGCSKRKAAPLHLGLNMWAGSIPFYAAADRGLYGTVKVELTDLDTNDASHGAVRERRIDLAAMSLFDALQMLDDCADFRIIMVTGYS